MVRVGRLLLLVVLVASLSGPPPAAAPVVGERFSEGAIVSPPSALPVVSAGALSTSNEVRVLFAFSNGVYQAFGSGGAVQNHLQGLVDVANEASSNSGVATTYAVAATVGVDVPDLWDSDDALGAVTTWDGIADGVFGLRATHAADVVVLVVGDLVDFDGIAWIGPDPSTAFSVIDLDCGGLCLAHELGHLHGGAHDPENAVGVGRTSYAYGFRIPGTLRTIMAYPCEFQGLAECSTVPYFSSPNLTYNGQALGGPDADNVRSMNDVSSVVAAAAPGQPSFPSGATLELVDEGAGVVAASWPAATPSSASYVLRILDLDTAVWGDVVVADTSARVGTFASGQRLSFQVLAWDDAGRVSFDGPAAFITVDGATVPTTTTSTTVPVFAGRFSDDDGSAFEVEIEWLADQGITTGCATERFCPSDVVTRGQMAAFLTRALGLGSPATNSFSDDDGSPFESDIEAIAAAGITQGCAAGLFCPDAPVTREQMAAFLTRALSLPASGVDAFSDDDGRFLEPEVQALAASGITTGCAPGRFCPTDPVTREQMAAFLFRALG